MINLIDDVFSRHKIQEISNSTNLPWDWKKLALPTSTITITLSKKLPEDTIYKIVSYLSMKDNLHLCLQK